MKKSQSIFLLSSLVPLVAAPIAIVVACSNDTISNEPADTLFRLKDVEITLNNLTNQEKELNQYVSDVAKLSQLIVDKKDEIFNNPPDYLSPIQVRIRAIRQDTTAGSLLFKLKVKVFTSYVGPDLIPETDIVLKGFSRLSPSL